ncbi:hypothetical protein N8813_01525 [bacterium]|nr:hypothetical protein [bacterium]
MSDDLAISILEEAHQIRASAIRKQSIVKALIGGPIALVSGFIAAFMSFYSEFTVSSLGICFYTICILTCF